MSPDKLDILYRISVHYANDPERVFKEIIREISQRYGNTMAMINLLDQECIRFQCVVNMHPIFQKDGSLSMGRTFCQFPIESKRPLRIQNAEQDPRFRQHIVVRLKLRRYLGVPIFNTANEVIGTLCFLDDNVNQELGPEDDQLLTLLASRVSSELERERLLQERIAVERAHAARLEATAQEKRQFVSMVIHDLRHPLTTMRTVLNLLEIDPDPQQRKLHLNALTNQTRALANLLDELVLYDQIEAGRPNLNVEPIDLRPFLEAAVEEVKTVAQADAVSIVLDTTEGPDMVATDAGKLSHILMNLLSNAQKYTTVGSIQVVARNETDEWWTLEVIDTGRGMGPEERARAFDPYFKGDATELSGMGLGLNIAQRLCKTLRANIELDSELGRGTRFKLTLPKRLEID